LQQSHNRLTPNEVNIAISPVLFAEKGGSGVSQPIEGDQALPDVPATDGAPSKARESPPSPLDIEDAQYYSMLEAISHSTADLIVIINAQGQVVYGNPIAQKVFGVTVKEAKGTQARLYLHPDDLEQNLLFFADVISTPGTSARQDVRTVSPAGEVRLLEVVCTNLLDDPSIHGIIINGKDVTERNEYIRSSKPWRSDSASPSRRTWRP
jgi:PAS domain S-box-containing protein